MIPGLVVVGICGRARSGKDTAAGILMLRRGCLRVALADAVKGAFDDLSGITREFHKEMDSAAGWTTRRAWQVLGTEARNDANAPGLWVHVVLAKIRYAAFYHPVPRRRFVVPDIRYRHEASMLRFAVERWGGKYGTLKLVRSDGSEIAEAAHSSEMEVDLVPVDHVYVNDGPLDSLDVATCSYFDSLVSAKE